MTETLPVRGTKWIARDGRHVIVDDVQKEMARSGWRARHKVFVRVLNATGRMRKQTVIDADYFGESGKFLRPAGASK